jgi:hypothetical protein
MPRSRVATDSSAMTSRRGPIFTAFQGLSAVSYIGPRPSQPLCDGNEKKYVKNGRQKNIVPFITLNFIKMRVSMKSFNIEMMN